MKKAYAIILFLVAIFASAAKAQTVISQVYVSASTATTATITWTTSTPSTSQVKYGTDATLPYSTAVVQTLSTTHSVQLILLSSSYLYYFAPVSKNGSGQTTQGPTLNFSLCGQPYVPLTATVNNYYEYGTYTATWVPPAGVSGTPTICGQAMPTTVTGSLSGGASFSASVADSYKAIPGPGSWQITVTDAGNLSPITTTYPVSAQNSDVSPVLNSLTAAAGLTAVIANLNTHAVYPGFICTTYSGCGSGFTLTTNGIDGPATLISGVLNIPTVVPSGQGPAIVANPTDNQTILEPYGKKLTLNNVSLSIASGGSLSYGANSPLGGYSSTPTISYASDSGAGLDTLITAGNGVGGTDNTSNIIMSAPNTVCIQGGVSSVVPNITTCQFTLSGAGAMLAAPNGTTSLSIRSAAFAQGGNKDIFNVYTALDATPSSTKVFAIGNASGGASSGITYIWSPTLGALSRACSVGDPCSSGSTGVTTFSAGNFSPLFTTTVTNPTSTPALAFTISNAAQNSVLAGPATGGAGAYSFQTAPTFSAANLTNFPTFNQNTTGTAANITATTNSTLTTLSSLSLPGTQVTGTVPASTLATNIAGGVLGSLLYQSGANTTALLAPNTTTTPCVIRETGTGSAGQAPVCDSAPAISAANMTSFPAGASGISGATAGQALIAGSATTATSSKALAGSGAGLTTGPTTSTTNDCVKFAGTTGQISDSGSPCGSGNLGPNALVNGTPVQSAQAITYASAYTAMGDSITQCNQGQPAASCYVAQVAAYYKWSASNLGVGGTQECDAFVGQIAANNINPDINQASAYSFAFGTNDADNGGLTYRPTASLCRSANHAWINTPASFKVLPDNAAVTYTGSGHFITSSSIKLCSLTSAGSCTFPITTTQTSGPIYLWYYLADSAAGVSSCVLDGTTTATLNTQPSPAINTLNGGHVAIGLYRFNAVTAGAHSIACTWVSGLSFPAGVGAPPPAGVYELAKVVYGGITYQSPTSTPISTPACLTPSTDAAVCQVYNSDISAQVAQDQVDGANAVYLNPRLCLPLNPAYYGDQLHPNGPGQILMGNCYTNAFNAVPGLGGSVTLSGLTVNAPGTVPTQIAGFYTPSLAGGFTYTATGVNNSSLNTGITGFNYAGSGSSSNYAASGILGAPGLVFYCANGGVVILGSTGTGCPGGTTILSINGTPFAVDSSGNLTANSLKSTGLSTAPCVSSVSGLLTAGCAGVGISSLITSATGGTGTGTVTCLTATCTNLRGSYSIAGGTFTTGTLLTLVWPTTSTAYVCTATMNGGTGFLGIGNSVATATGMNITNGVSVATLTVTVNYSCVP